MAIKVVISPAKTLDFETAPAIDQFSEPRFLDDSETLITELRELSEDDISSLMKVSDAIAELNAKRFEDWKRPFQPQNAKQAVLSFKGDVYQGLNAETLSAKQFSQLDSKLRILSGLYGLLKPLDLIQPYRLEMGTKFANSAGPNLYKFWGDKLVDSLNDEMADDDVLINLASNEYFKALPKKKIKSRVVTPAFKDYKNGEYKMISFYAKKARGLMVRYIIDNAIDSAEGIEKFNYEGYSFNKELSKPDSPVFTRKLAE